MPHSDSLSSLSHLLPDTSPFPSPPATPVPLLRRIEECGSSIFSSSPSSFSAVGSSPFQTSSRGLFSRTPSLTIGLESLPELNLNPDSLNPGSLIPILNESLDLLRYIEENKSTVSRAEFQKLIDAGNRMNDFVNEFLTRSQMESQPDLIEVSRQVHDIRTPLLSLDTLLKELAHSEVDLVNQTDNFSDLNQIYVSLEKLMKPFIQPQIFQEERLLFSEFNIDTLLGVTLSNTKGLAQQYGVSLEPSVAKALENNPLLIGDSMKVQRILTNLISNAIKFTEDQKVEISVDLISPPKERFCEIKFSVKNAGKGISEENQKKLFQDFVQLEERKKNTTGLGLSGSQHLARALGGTIEIDSKENQYTCFHFTLRFQKKSDLSPRGVRSPLPQQIRKSSFDPLKEDIVMLIAEDDPLLCKILQRRFTSGQNKSGPELTFVDSGENALGEFSARLSSKKPYSVVMLDMNMKGQMTGWETAEKINGLDPKVLIFVYSGSPEVLDKIHSQLPKGSPLKQIRVMGKGADSITKIVSQVNQFELR